MPWHLSVDLRHWFYQIAIPDWLTHHFCVSTDQGPGQPPLKAEARCLPMGFGWSPYLAQCIVWRLILGLSTWWLRIDAHNGEGDSPPAFAHIWWVDPTGPCSSMPHPRDIRTVPNVQRGVIFAWYDNVVAWCSGRQGLVALARALDRDSKRAHMIWKGEDCSTYVSNHHPYAPVTVLGVVWQWIPEIKLPNCSIPLPVTFNVQVDPATIEEWMTHPIRAADPVLTNRQVASAVGAIIWASTIRLVPMCMYAHIVRLSSRIYTGGVVIWDAITDLDMATLRGLQQVWERILLNEPTRIEATPKALQVGHQPTVSASSALFPEYCNACGETVNSADARPSTVTCCRLSRLKLKMPMVPFSCTSRSIAVTPRVITSC
jgi:hypothetical protein